MSIEKNLKKRTERRRFRVRNKLRSVDGKPRVSVFRSLKQIYAQIIDDSSHGTLASASSLALKKDVKGDKKSVAKKVGMELAKIALEKGITEVFFDRGSCKYHGRVRAVAEGLREGGLKF